MGKLLTEKDVLKKLGIKDFRHLSKKNVMEFASNLHLMDPEVAIEAIRQFPKFAENVKEVMSIYKEIVLKEYETNSQSVKDFNKSCDMVIDQLGRLLKKEELSFEEKGRVMDKIMEILKMRMEMDKEDKKHRQSIFKSICGVFVAVIGIMATIFEMKFSKKN